MKAPIQPNQIKKRPVNGQRQRSLSMSVLALTGSGRNVYKMQERAATHDEMMQRFQLRRVPSDKHVPVNFGRGKNVVIDKTTGGKPRKPQRFSLRRTLRAVTGAKARNQLLTRLLSPITPKSWTSTIHGIVMLVVYHFQLLYLPFAPSYFPHGALCSTIAIATVEALFLADLLLNFNTAYVEQGVLVTSRRKIARNYVRKWFCFDLLSALPLQLAFCCFTGALDQTHPTVRGIQLTLMTLRLLRATFLEKGVLLSRVMRVANHVAEWVRYSRYSHLLGIAQLMWLVLLIAHYMACLWHVVARDHAGISRQEDTVGHQYVADYYYAVSLIQGQGNATGTWDENVFSSVAIIVGSVILAIVFGNVAMLVSNFNANTTNYHRKMEAVYATMDKLDLPLKLRERVNEYYTHVWLEYEALDGNINKFQQELTHTLRIEIGLYKFMNLVVKIPFWEDCTPDFLTQIVLSLGVRAYMPDDYVVRRREIGSEMMMINLGYCKLSKPMKHNDDKPSRGPAVADFSDDTEKPVLMPEDLGSPEQAEAEDGSDDEWDDTSSDEDSDDDLSSDPFGAPAAIRRQSGSVFELQCGDADNSMAEIKTDRPRRHSNPSSVEILDRPKKFRAYLNPGTAFGEMSLLMNYKRQANVRAVTFVEMCVLDRSTFQRIISRYPEDRRRVLTKMLESCIEKKEIPFPWENIIEAVCAKRRISGKKDISRASVIATMTAAEAARILVEAIDVNVPDDTIKYGFQSFDQQFVDEPALRRAHSVGAKIREALQRTHSGLRETLQRTNSGLREPLQRSNSGLSDMLLRANSGLREPLQRSNSGVVPFRSYSRRNSSVDSGRSSTTAELTEPESDTSGVSAQNPGSTEKTLESMMRLMHTLVESISRLQQDVTELKARGGPSFGGCCCNRSEGVGQPSQGLKKRRSLSDSSGRAHFDSTLGLATHDQNRQPAVRKTEASVADAAVQHEAQPPRQPSLLSILPPAVRGSSTSKRNETMTRRDSSNLDARRGIIYSGRSSQRPSQYELKRGTSGMKVTPRADLPVEMEGFQPPQQIVVDPYADPQPGKLSTRSKSGRQSTLADMLWKRSNTSVDLLRRSSASKMRQKLKSRHSLPAGVAVTAATSTENEMPPIPDEGDGPAETSQLEAPSSYRAHALSHREYMPPSSRGSATQGNPDPRCMKIEE